MNCNCGVVVLIDTQARLTIVGIITALANNRRNRIGGVMNIQHSMPGSSTMSTNESVCIDFLKEKVKLFVAIFGDVWLNVGVVSPDIAHTGSVANKDTPAKRGIL